MAAKKVAQGGRMMQDQNSNLSRSMLNKLPKVQEYAETRSVNLKEKLIEPIR